MTTEVSARTRASSLHIDGVVMVVVMHPRAVAWFALLIASSAAALITLRVTRAFDIYCDGSRPCVDLLIAAIPGDVALLGMTLRRY